MRWAIFALAIALMVSAPLYLQARQIRADQGFVKSDDGQEWKLKKMQTLGLAGDYVAVYEKLK